MPEQIEPCECGYGTIDAAGFNAFHALDCPKNPTAHLLLGRAPTLVFEHPKLVSRETYQRIKDQAAEVFPDSKVMILDGGLKVKQMFSHDPEVIAQAFHEAYEELAPRFNYETREESAVEWDDVPVDNRDLMIATVTKLLEDGVIS